MWLFNLFSPASAELPKGPEAPFKSKVLAESSESVPEWIKEMLQLDLWLDEDIQKAINYVNDNYLSKAYPKDYVEKNPHLAKRDIKCCGITQTIQRPWHGLAHTLRGAYLIPILSALYRVSNSEDLQDIKAYLNENKDNVKRLVITYLFTVVGRENEAGFENDEAYQANLERSAQAFNEYAKVHLKHLFSHHMTLASYKNIILNYGDPDSHDPRYILFRHSHGLDLLRCRSANQFKRSIFPGVDNKPHTLQKDFGDEIAGALKAYSEMLLKATGSCIMAVDAGYVSHDNGKFILANGVPKTCIEMLLSAQMPTALASELYKLQQPSDRLVEREASLSSNPRVTKKYKV